MISTYPVGLLADLKNGRKLKHIVRSLHYRTERRKWREVRNYFNGYLAEWHYPPEGMRYKRCGRGWSRKAALRDLAKHIVESNAPELRDRH